MSTIDMTVGTQTGKGRASTYGKPIVTIYRLLDLAKANTKKGTTLASADLIHVIGLPKGTRTLSAGAKVLEAVAKTPGGSAVAQFLFKVGNTANSSVFVTSGDATSVGFAPNNDTNATFIQTTTSTDNIDVTVFSFSGTIPGAGVIAVFADIADYNEFPGANIDATTNLAGVPGA